MLPDIGHMCRQILSGQRDRKQLRHECSPETKASHRGLCFYPKRPKVSSLDELFPILPVV